jgi:GDPmannose 4,6-dehydratase
MTTSQRALVCGISGQDAAYVACLLLSEGWEVHGTTRDASQAFWRLKSLGIECKVRIHEVQLEDPAEVSALMELTRPNEVYALSAQSSVGSSFELSLETARAAQLPVVNLLEAIRHGDRSIRLFNAGSSECFGDAPEAVHADTPFNPRNPYGIAKAAAAWFVQLYRIKYGLHASTGYLFNHESPLRSPLFVTRKIADAVGRLTQGDTSQLRLGDLSIERDWGWAPDYALCMRRMLLASEPVDVVIATGRPISLESFVEAAFAEAGYDWRKHVVVDRSLFRPGELRRSCGDPTRACELLGWEAGMSGQEVAREMVRATSLIKRTNQ